MATTGLVDEVVAIATRAHRDLDAALAAAHTDTSPDSSAQAALDRVTALARAALQDRQRHLLIRDVFAAIEGRP